ncbi:BrnA antitoxin family protein [Francisella philomiragia]|uniref:BrnA antitoxin family protein n=1 Tax=Francisella philomiragia TaxID=28110 RepID=UPI00351290CC
MGDLNRLLKIADNIKDEDIIIDDESRELTDEDIKNAVPFFEAHEIQDILSNKKKKDTKEKITIRIKSSTLDTFRSLGKGYQTKISDILDNIAKNIKKHS